MLCVRFSELFLFVFEGDGCGFYKGGELAYNRGGGCRVMGAIGF